MYSSLNPASYYSDIEVAPSRTSCSRTTYVTIQDLELRYGGDNGINFWRKNDFTVMDCDISFIGGR